MLPYLLVIRVPPRKAPSPSTPSRIGCQANQRRHSNTGDGADARHFPPTIFIICLGNHKACGSRMLRNPIWAKWLLSKVRHAVPRLRQGPRRNPPRKPVESNEMTNSTRATKNTIFAIPTAAPAMPPKPRMAAMIAIIKSV